MGQWIFGKASPVSVTEQGKQLLKSSGCIVSDFLGESGASVNKILCSFEAVPIAFHSVPTLNQMVFSKALWENLFSNQYFKRTLEDGTHFGESKHADRDEVYLDEVACRVTKAWIGDNNLVLGNVDILDTPKGRIADSLARISRIGISSRGFGELAPRSDGLKDVTPDEYMHVCWDLVSFPAVPDATMTLITGDMPDTETINMSNELRNLIREAYERNPKDKALQKLMSNVRIPTGKKYDYAPLRNAISDVVIERELKSKLIKSNVSILKSATDPDTGEYIDPVKGATLASELKDIYGVTFAVGDDIGKLHKLGLDAKQEALSAFGKLLETEQKWESDPQGPAKRTQKIYKLQDIYDMAKKELRAQLKLGNNKDYDRVYRAMGFLLSGKYGVDYLYRNTLPVGFTPVNQSYAPLHSSKGGCIIKSADTGSYSTELAIKGAVEVFIERIGILLQDRIPTVCLFRDDGFEDVGNALVLRTWFTETEDEGSRRILTLEFRVQDGIMDHGFIKCTSENRVVAEIPLGKYEDNLRDANAESLVTAVLGG